MKKINEDIVINDPTLALQYANGQKQLVELDKQINSIQMNINKIEQRKMAITKTMAQIEQKSAQSAGQIQVQQPVAQQPTQGTQQSTQPVQATSESLLTRTSDKSLRSILNEKTNMLVYLRTHNGYHKEIKHVSNQIDKLNKQLNESVNPNYVEGNKFTMDGKSYRIQDVDHISSNLLFISVWDEENKKSRKFTSKHLERNNAEFLVDKPKPESIRHIPKLRKERAMTTQEFEKMVKGALGDLWDDQEDDSHSMIYDMAESMIHDQRLSDYLSKQYKQWNGHSPNDTELQEYLTDRMSNLTESNNPMSSKNFYDVSEAYIEIDGEEGRESNKEDFIDDDFVIYVKINDNDNEFIGKIFKMSPDGEWYGIVKKGKDHSFEQLSYSASFDDFQVVEFLKDNYAAVEIIDTREFNEYVDEKVDKDIDYEEDEVEEGMTGMYLGRR